jgi:hypothetical protein
MLHKQGNQKVSVRVMLTIQITLLSQHTTFLPHCVAQTDCLVADRQGQGESKLTLTPSIFPNSNYIIMVSDGNCLKYFSMFLYCNHQVHRVFLNTLYLDFPPIRHCWRGGPRNYFIEVRTTSRRASAYL